MAKRRYASPIVLSAGRLLPPLSQAVVRSSRSILQLLPLSALAARRLRTSADRCARLVFAFASSYVGLFGVLSWQALRGQSVFAPDASVSAALITWAALSGALTWLALRRPTLSSRVPAVAS